MNRYLLFAVLLAGALLAQKSNYPPVLEGAQAKTYKHASDVDLNLWIYTPEGHTASNRRPAIVFFFGGGWRSGTPAQFEHHSEYLASRGMVAITADYRVSSRHGVKAVSCVEDAKSAIRWVREHAAELGIDPTRIAAGGGSAGGHLAAATATIAGFDRVGENQEVSSHPDALVLFNPALVIAPADGNQFGQEEKFAERKARTGVDPVQISPYHHINKSTPPAIIFHGKADTTVPYATAEVFTAKMKKIGNRCELVGYDDKAHGFFNYGRDGGGAYLDTVRRMDGFLASLGWLKGNPTVGN